MLDPVTQAALDVIHRAHAGDATALPELRALFDACPGLWQQLGDVSKHTEDELLIHKSPVDLDLAAAGRSLESIQDQVR